MLINLRTGRFKDHPIHPILVHVPIGLIVGALIFDIAHMISGVGALAGASYFCLLTGILFTIPTAIFGLIELGFTPPGSRVRSLAILHGVLNVAMLALAIVSYVIRDASYEGAPTGVPPLAFVLLLISVGVLSVSGYYGGKMVYEYGAGRHPEQRDEQLRGERLRERRREVA